MENIANVHTHIDIKQEINNYVKHRKCNPTIIFDLVSIPIRNRNYYDNFCGGRHQCNQQSLITFFDSLKELNVTMIFVKNGSIRIDESEHWHDKMQRKLTIETRIARDVRYKKDLNTLVQKHGSYSFYLLVNTHKA